MDEIAVQICAVNIQENTPYTDSDIKREINNQYVSCFSRRYSHVLGLQLESRKPLKVRGRSLYRYKSRVQLIIARNQNN